MPKPIQFPIETSVWEFTSAADQGAEPEVERVAARSLEQALKHLHEQRPSFTVHKAECLYMLVVLSGDPWGE